MGWQNTSWWSKSAHCSGHEDLQLGITSSFQTILFHEWTYLFKSYNLIPVLLEVVCNDLNTQYLLCIYFSTRSLGIHPNVSTDKDTMFVYKLVGKSFQDIKGFTTISVFIKINFNSADPNLLTFMIQWKHSPSALLTMEPQLPIWFKSLFNIFLWQIKTLSISFRSLSWSYWINLILFYIFYWQLYSSLLSNMFF